MSNISLKVSTKAAAKIVMIRVPIVQAQTNQVAKHQIETHRVQGRSVTLTTQILTSGSHDAIGIGSEKFQSGMKDQFEINTP